MAQGCVDVEEAGLATTDECYDAIEQVGRSRVDALWATCASKSESLSQTRICYRDIVFDLITISR